MHLRLFPGLAECHAKKEAWCVPRGAGIPPVATLLAQHAGLIVKVGASLQRGMHGHDVVAVRGLRQQLGDQEVAAGQYQCPWASWTPGPYWSC